MTFYIKLCPAILHSYEKIARLRKLIFCSPMCAEVGGRFDYHVWHNGPQTGGLEENEKEKTAEEV